MKVVYLLQSSFFIWLGTCTVSSVALTLNDTTSNTTSATPSQIACYIHPEDIRIPITIAQCRSLLNYLKTFPRYRISQDFQTGRSPRLPRTPPYTWWNQSTTCALRVQSENPHLVQKFAWEQVRALAIEILQHCEDTSLGLGGIAPIGKPPFGVQGFSVRVIGASFPPLEPPLDGTDDAFGRSATANATIGETSWFDTS